MVKLLINSIISIQRATFMTMDIKNFYLQIPLTNYEFDKIKFKDFPKKSLMNTNLTPSTNMDESTLRYNKHGLPQVGKLAYDLLTQYFATHGYYACAITPDLFHHNLCLITFSLIVNEYRVEYIMKEHTKRLVSTLEVSTN